MFNRNVFGVDLGTSEIKIYSFRKNRLLHEHNMIAIKDASQVLAVGNDAYEMYEKNPPGIVVERPVANGRIADVAEVEMLLRLLLKKTDSHAGPRASICFSAPCNMSEIEKRAYYAISNLGDLRNPSVMLIDRPICTACQLGIDIAETRGSMILDIGAQSTEVSVITQGQVIVSDSIAIGGQDLNEAIVSEIRRSRNLLIGQKTARRLKISLSSLEAGAEESRKVTGIDTLSGLPREDEISGRIVSRAVEDEMTRGAEEMRLFLERTPPQIRNSVLQEGIFLTGATARIRGIDRFLTRMIGSRIRVSPDYEFCTVKGIKKIIDDKEMKEYIRSVRKK